MRSCARIARPVTAVPGKALPRTEPAGTCSACSHTQALQTQTVTANGQADWIKGGETITEFTFTAASGGRCRAESMDAKLDAGEDPTEDNEANSH
jgi:hypothetical protein